MVDAWEEVGFDLLTEVAELELHARVPDVPAVNLLLKWTPVKLQNTQNRFEQVDLIRFLVAKKIFLNCSISEWKIFLEGNYGM